LEIFSLKLAKFVSQIIQEMAAQPSPELSEIQTWLALG